MADDDLSDRIQSIADSGALRPYLVEEDRETLLEAVIVVRRHETEVESLRGWLRVANGKKEATQAELHRLERHVRQETERADANGDQYEKLVAALRDRHRPKTGSSPRYAPDDYDAEREPVSWEDYTICAHDGASWPCATVRIIEEN